MWNLNYDTNELTYETETDSQIQRTNYWLLENKLVVTSEEREGGKGNIRVRD